MRCRAALALTLAVALAAASRASADDVATTHVRERRHAAYVELLGKGGWWGVGYDYALSRRFAIGGTVSYYGDEGEHVLSLSPYLAIYPIGERHRWFVQAGPQIVHLSRMSPVPEWSGQSSTGMGAEVCTGYELRSRVLFRAFAMGTAGSGAATPWLGISLGVAL